MRKILFALSALIVLPIHAAEPVFAVPPMKYGRIDNTQFPDPPTLSAQPVTAGELRGSDSAPLYLHVPSAQTKRWDRYCQRYEACGRPVYFVQSDWYKNVYTPRYKSANPKPESMDMSGRPRDERGSDSDRVKDNLDRGPGDRGTKPPPKDASQ